MDSPPGYSSSTSTKTVDTTIRGVVIQFRYAPEIFPDSWRESPISAAGESILPSEAERSQHIIRKALEKYPPTLLNENLHFVYLLKSMKFYNVGYGGTNSTDAIYLTNNGIAKGYTDRYVEQTFHHEFSSILYRNYTLLLDTASWKNANMSSFDYNDPENGVGAIRNNKSSQELDSILCSQGFLTQYAISSLENDLNTISQNLFVPSKGFWEIADKYPRIRKKVLLLIRFYNLLDPAFTESYFKSFNK